MENNRIKALIFLIVIVLFIVEGYIFMKKSFNPINNTSNIINNNKAEIVKDIRLDKTKDYIYYENNDRIVDELDIEYKNVVINFKDDKKIANLLNEETKKQKETLKYDDSLEESSYEKLIFADYKTYDIFLYNKYVSLLVNYYSFDRENLVTYKGSISYVFDKNTGSLLNTNDLLKIYELTEEKVNNIIIEYLKGQDLLKEEESLDIDGTINDIDKYTLFIDKVGRLSISILVKSDLKNYNDIIILN